MKEQMNVEVKVLDINGNELPSTMRNGKVRKLLKDNKAKVVKKFPFTIQLLYDIDSNIDNKYLNQEFINKLIELSKKSKDIRQNNKTINALCEFSYKHYSDLSDATTTHTIDTELKNKFKNMNYIFSSFNDKYHMTDKLGCAKFPPSLDLVIGYFSFPLLYEIEHLYEQDINRIKVTRDYFNKNRIFDNDTTNELLQLLDDLKAVLDDVHSDYVEVMSLYKPYRIIVTNDNIIPKYTDFESIVISEDDYYQMLKDDKNSFRFSILCDAAITIDINPKQNKKLLQAYLNKEISSLFTPVTCYFLNNDKIDLQTANTIEDSYNKVIVYDINDTWTIDEATKYFNEHETESNDILYKKYINSIENEHAEDIDTTIIAKNALKQYNIQTIYDNIKVINYKHVFMTPENAIKMSKNNRNFYHQNILPAFKTAVDENVILDLDVLPIRASLDIIKDNSILDIDYHYPCMLVNESVSKISNKNRFSKQVEIIIKEISNEFYYYDTNKFIRLDHVYLCDLSNVVRDNANVKSTLERYDTAIKDGFKYILDTNYNNIFKVDIIEDFLTMLEYFKNITKNILKTLKDNNVNCVTELSQDILNEINYKSSIICFNDVYHDKNYDTKNILNNLPYEVAKKAVTMINYINKYSYHTQIYFIIDKGFIAEFLK